MTRVGLISDTHGLLRPEALAALKGTELILHAGDIGAAEIIPALAELAPVKAVRGNVDTAAWAYRFPLTEAIQVEGVYIYMYHGHLEMDIDPKAGGFSVVLSGHSHQPKIETKQGLLFVNPGSAGHKRFNLPVSLARLDVEGKKARAELIYLA